MTYFSENPYMEIGENYTRGMLCEYMDIKYCKEEIERGIYKPNKFSSVFFFSTLENPFRYFNGRFSANEFLFSSNKNYLDNMVTQHNLNHNELILFIRKDEETGFYYFGRCKYSGDYRIKGYGYPLYILELIDTGFSKVKYIEVPLVC